MIGFAVLVGSIAFLFAIYWFGTRGLWLIPALLSLVFAGLVLWIDPLSNGEGAIGDPHGHLLLSALVGVPMVSWLLYFGGRIRARQSSTDLH